MEWVEIREPHTKLPMFVHLETGDCVDSVTDLSTVKRLDKNQWWEFFDQHTSRFYYYNYWTEQTVWHKPSKADIIPLAKLQNLKQNSKGSNSKRTSCSAGTQTAVGSPGSHSVETSSTPSCRRNTSLAGSTRRPEIRKTPTQSRRRERSCRDDSSSTDTVYYSPSPSNVQRYPSHHSVQSSWSSGHGTLQKPVNSSSPLPGRQAPSEASLDSGCGMLHCDIVGACPVPANWDSGSDQGYASVPRPAAGAAIPRPRQFPRTNPALVRPSPILTRGSASSPVNTTSSINQQGTSSRSHSTVSVSSGSTTVEAPPSVVQRQSSEPLNNNSTAPSTPNSQRPQSMMVKEATYLTATTASHQPTRSASGHQLESSLPPVLPTPPGWSLSLFRKDNHPQKLLSYTKDSISKPLLIHTEKTHKKEAIEVFKHIQSFMGDRKTKLSQMQLAHHIVSKGWTVSGLRDEILMQLCKQTTNNMNSESICRGWELLATCLAFFPPSTTFSPYLEGFLLRHQDITEPFLFPKQSEYAIVTYRRLKRVLLSGPRKGNVPPSQDEVLQAKQSVLVPGVFGSALEDLMEQQRVRHKVSSDCTLPWVYTLLCDEIIRLGGLRTEGIFRIPGDVDQMNAARVRLEQWDEGACRGLDEPFTPASLLKLWLRELAEPLIPVHLYPSVLEAHENPGLACQLVLLMPEIHGNILRNLVQFLRQVFQAVLLTKMTAESLSLVMAPNLFRPISTNPQTAFNNARKEAGFLKNLLIHLPSPEDTVYLDEVCEESTSSSCSSSQQTPPPKDSLLAVKDDLPGIDEEDLDEDIAGVYENSSPRTSVCRNTRGASTQH